MPALPTENDGKTLTDLIEQFVKISGVNFYIDIGCEMNSCC